MDATRAALESIPDVCLAGPGSGGTVQCVTAVGLRYVSDSMPGIQRRRTRDGFRYLDPQGRPVRDDEVLKRIRALRVPPAYEDVWICADPAGYLQATARDARGRKQYRYHPQWRSLREETKYYRMVPFGEALPGIRMQVDHDLSDRQLSRSKVLAAVVRLLETTLIRVGNEEYAKANHHYGLTTLRDRHVGIEGSTLRFQFRGKSGKDHQVAVTDRRLARVVARCRDLPGQELFQYVDEAGTRRSVGSADVNAYLREVSGEDFTAKDFRTWAGTVMAYDLLLCCPPASSEAERRRLLAGVVQSVSERLGNTRAVCRKCYLHPSVVEAYLDGSLVAPEGGEEGASAGLHPDERRLLWFLRRQEGFVRQQAEPPAKAPTAWAVADRGAGHRTRISP